MEDAFSTWTPLTADRLRAAAERLAAAVTAHADAVASAGGDADITDVFAAGERLVPAVLEYADAQFEHTGTGFPLGVLHQFAGEDGDDPAEDAPPPPGISVLQRHDYAVTDEAAVLAAGRAAYRRLWPDDDEAAAAADVDHLGRALYQVAHAEGWDALRAVDGLRPTGGCVVVTAPDEVLGPDPDQWPDEVFDSPGGELLYRQDDVFPA